ncbi:hypothetical protein [Methylobacterium sp. GC_Met_2]|uniref:hypothetical protein n=1 Tax=Methylobacterium sp. GC_Met_2 TaxID=2937376 RepID=UPI00226B80CF|nr:hypothetical protein [Methylobacterium sp. GC_Met_2]
MDQERDRSKEPPISDGQSGRPRDATIAQTGPGLPDDTGRPVEADEAARIARTIRELF